MKKMYKLFSMLLAVAMLLTSTVALAEETMPMFYIDLEDIQMSMDGEMLLDLTGAKLRLSAGATDNEGALTASVYGNDNRLLNAVAALVGEKVLFNVDGMAKPLAVNLAEILPEGTDMASAFQSGFEMGAGAAMTEEQQAGAEQMVGAIMELSSDEGMVQLMDNVSTCLAESANMIAEKVTMEEVAANEFFFGEVEEEAQVITLTMGQEELAALLFDIGELCDATPALMDLINGMLIMSGEETIDSVGALLTEETCAMLAEEMLYDAQMILNMYENATSELFDLQFSIVNAEDASDVYTQLSFGLGTDNGFEMLCSLYDGYEEVFFDMSVLPSEDYPGETEYYASLNSVIGEDFEQLASLWVGPDPDFGTLGTLNFMPEDEYDAAGFAWGIDDANGQYIFSAYTNNSSIEVGFVAQEDGNAQVYLTVDDYGTVMEITATMSAGMEDQPLSAFTGLGQNGVIDLLTASEDELTAAGEEAGMVVMGALMELATLIPELGMLLDM